VAKKIKMPYDGERRFMTGISWEEFLGAKLKGGRCEFESHGVIYIGIIQKHYRFGDTPYIIVECAWQGQRHRDPRDSWETLMEFPHSCFIIGLFDRLYRKSDKRFGWSNRPIVFA
jgi:hypothetical protein